MTVKTDFKTGSGIRIILCMNSPVLAFYNFLCQGQADSDTSAFGILPAEKTFEKVGQIFFCKAVTLIPDDYLCIKRILFIRTVDNSSRRRMLHTVFQQIHDRFHGPVHIGGYPGRFSFRDIH